MKKRIANLVLAVILMMNGMAFISCNTNEVAVENKNLVVDVMSEYYGAKGDGSTSDRQIIQVAIDEVSQAGGGTVILTSGHTFLSGNLILRSNVELHFGDGAVLLQNSDPDDYIEVRGYDYGHAKAYGYSNGFVEVGEPYTPLVGIQILPNDGIIWPEVTGFWREIWYWNYPLIYAGEGTENIKITGNGTIQSMKYVWNNQSNFIYMNMLGFYKVNNVLVSDIAINFEGGHCTNFIMCKNGVIRDVKMLTPAATTDDFSKVASICDALKLNNCQDFLVTNSTFAGGDDSLLIMSSYGDKRLDRWSSSTEVQPTKNIEVSNSYFPSYYKGLGFAALGNACPDLSKVEISDIYIHDNYFCSVGMWSDHRGWLTNPNLPSYGEFVPMKNIRWERNNYEYWTDEYNHNEDSQSIQNGMSSYPISDQISDDPRLHSMTKMMNGDFEYGGMGYWIPITEKGSISEVRTENGNNYGYLGNLENGSAKLYEGIYLRYGDHVLKAKIKTGGGAKVRLYVRTQDNTLIASKEITLLDDWSEIALEFSMPGNSLLGKNCRVGIESVDAKGWAMVDDFELK